MSRQDQYYNSRGMRRLLLRAEESALNRTRSFAQAYDCFLEMEEEAQLDIARLCVNILTNVRNRDGYLQFGHLAAFEVLAAVTVYEGPVRQRNPESPPRREEPLRQLRTTCGYCGLVITHRRPIIWCPECNCFRLKTEVQP